MQSRLAARHLLFAHAAVTDVQGRKLWHDQRIARWSGEPAGSNPADVAHASTEDTAVVIRDWFLQRSGAPFAGAGSCDLTLCWTWSYRPCQPVLLQGVDGLSRKGPQVQQASYYYSVPQLQVRGSVTLKDQKYPLATGSTAWLDHEWSQEVLHPNAVGWDWIGINMLDGGALTAFRLRTAQDTALWDGGSYRSGQGVRQVFAQGELAFTPQRRWTSPASRASYPVEWLVRTPAGSFTVKALLDDQELDSRSSTGAIYWEGLCEVWNTNAEPGGPRLSGDDWLRQPAQDHEVICYKK